MKVIFALLCLLLLGVTPARAGDQSSLSSPPPLARPAAFQTCKHQDYALCAVAKCFVFNGLSYCSCEVKSGDSISLPFNYHLGRDICTVNAEGANNGYMMSTFSLPPSVIAPVGDQALYDCPAATSDGAYEQCDGGVCFTSSEGQFFPGFPRQLGKKQIICSCPVVVADPATAKLGYQIAGPYPCQDTFFHNCKSTTANTNTGSHIYVGAPSGSARFLTRELYGFVPPLHECHYPAGPPLPN